MVGPAAHDSDAANSGQGSDGVPVPPDFTGVTWKPKTCPLSDEAIRNLELDGGMLRGWCDTYHLKDHAPGDWPKAADRRKRYRQMPETFYATTGYNVVTPDNCEAFLKIHRRWMALTGKSITWDFWEMWAGTARSSTSAYQHELLTGFPVDLRYGWNLYDKNHRRLLGAVDDLFKPKVTLGAPERRWWSRSGNTADPVEKAAGRQYELPMLLWLVRHCKKLMKSERIFIIENPFGSDIFKSSPLSELVNAKG